jgi:pimeloyl-ACP methyl ester carboxylesterase
MQGEFYRAVDVQDVFYNDLPKDVADHWYSKLTFQSVASFQRKQTYSAWKYIPTTYVICELDKAIPPAAQEGMASQEGGLFTIERINSSHSPFLSKPKETAEVIRKAVGESF